MSVLDREMSVDFSPIGSRRDAANPWIGVFSNVSLCLFRRGATGFGLVIHGFAPFFHGLVVFFHACIFPSDTAILLLSLIISKRKRDIGGVERGPTHPRVRIFYVELIHGLLPRPRLNPWICVEWFLPHYHCLMCDQSPDPRVHRLRRHRAIESRAACWI